MPPKKREFSAAETLVIIDEYPLCGPGGMLHDTAVDALQLRHRSMLTRLARIVESCARG